MEVLLFNELVKKINIRISGACAWYVHTIPPKLNVALLCKLN